MAVHDRGRRPQAQRVRGANHIQPLRRVDLVGRNHCTNVVVEDLRRGPRQRAEPGILQRRQKRRDRHAERRRTLRYLQRR